jgi:hypothetical protein
MDMRADVLHKPHRGQFPIVEFELTSILETCLNPGLLRVQAINETCDHKLKLGLINIEAVRYTAVAIQFVEAI